MDYQQMPQHWEIPEFKRGTGRPHTNWKSTVNKDLQSPGRKQRWQL